ncbi:reverse transcriptase domain-containing protein [Tanacetum coccineum]
MKRPKRKMVRTLSSNEKKRKDREATEAWMNVPITFPGVVSDDASDEPLIIEAEVEGYLVRRVYVDEGSSVEVMFEHCFENLPPKVRDGLRETRTDLVGFAGEVAKPLGKIELEVCFGNEGLSRRMSIKFLVIRAPLSLQHNLEKDSRFESNCMLFPSAIHSMIRLPLQNGIASLGRNLEAYVDALVIKAMMRKVSWQTLQNLFRKLENKNMKLNPNKNVRLFVSEGTIFVKSLSHRKESGQTLKDQRPYRISLPKTLKECKKSQRKNRNGRQCPVQYVSRTLNDAEKNYSPLEKLALSLVNMMRRLRRYFEAHPVKVITDQPIKNILSRAEASGKLANVVCSGRRGGKRVLSTCPKYHMRLMTLEVWTLLRKDAGQPERLRKRVSCYWTLWFLGVLLFGPSFNGVYRISTNNEAEYEALLAGLRIARKIKVSGIEVKVKISKLCCYIQINGHMKLPKNKCQVLAKQGVHPQN